MNRLLFASVARKVIPPPAFVVPDSVTEMVQSDTPDSTTAQPCALPVTLYALLLVMPHVPARAVQVWPVSVVPRVVEESARLNESVIGRLPPLAT
jgi:hypothetical protein